MKNYRMMGILSRLKRSFVGWDHFPFSNSRSYDGTVVPSTMLVRDDGPKLRDFDVNPVR
jgi:hypothetical protein